MSILWHVLTVVEHAVIWVVLRHRMNTEMFTTLKTDLEYMYSITVDFGEISSETLNVFCVGNEKPYTKSNSMEIGIRILLLYFERVSLNLTRIYLDLGLYDVLLGAIKLLY
jgi:hypothetical protein